MPYDEYVMTLSTVVSSFMSEGQACALQENSTLCILNHSFRVFQLLACGFDVHLAAAMSDIHRNGVISRENQRLITEEISPSMFGLSDRITANDNTLLLHDGRLVVLESTVASHGDRIGANEAGILHNGNNDIKEHNSIGNRIGNNLNSVRELDARVATLESSGGGGGGPGFP
jgi:hypothetical protein